MWLIELHDCLSMNLCFAITNTENEEKTGMNNKTNLKIKKYNMIMWSFLGAVSFIILILTILSLAGVLDVLFNPVLGILIPAVMVLSACSQIRAYLMETMFFFEKAQDSDKDAVIELLNAAKEDMKENGIDQWDEQYPVISDVSKDIKEGTLTLVKQGGKLVAVYTLDKVQDTAYKFGNFKDTSDNFAVLHRLCVHPKYQGMKIASEALKHIDETALKEGFSSIRLDVFTKNPRAVKIYENAGYSYVGDAYFRKGKFLLMEKLILDGTSGQPAEPEK